MGEQAGKKQGRRRSIPTTTLPAPEIKIGSRLPVNAACTGFVPGNVSQFTNRAKNAAEGLGNRNGQSAQNCAESDAAEVETALSSTR